MLLVFHKDPKIKPRVGKIVIVAHRTHGIMQCGPAKFDGEFYHGFDGLRITNIDGWAHFPRHFDDKTRRW
jgi:hypothetical protein